ncbi:MAG: LemA family protein [Paludibacter sp.]|nr:LemA family protein [Bacteroidales bacterium]MCM1069636.1 LemA family protein [Prevotella sp.]MCM1354282.1 LemA family protein [Bacteroides sp.]MCM1443121.1 LemA family protein [Muribaculum sp.]MCM1482356.1 LemA family protein [Paludibacter sp.]
MKKGTLAGIIIIAVIAIVAIWGFGKYNTLVEKQENVDTAWAQVENQYQRRMDLIPNLVNTVKGYAAHESATLEAVIEARSKATSVSIDAASLTETNLQAFQQAQGELSNALGRLMAVREAYPDLKANQNFLELQSQLEGTENRITVARNAFNEQARLYNIAIRRFPANMVAGMCGFEKKPLFKAEAGAEHAPVVEF